MSNERNMSGLPHRSTEAYLQAQETRLEEMHQRHNARIAASGLVELAWQHSANELKKSADKNTFRLSSSWLVPRLTVSLLFAVLEQKERYGSFKGKLLATGFLMPKGKLDMARVPHAMWNEFGENEILIASPAEPAFKVHMPMLLELAREELRIRSEHQI